MIALLVSMAMAGGPCERGVTGHVGTGFASHYDRQFYVPVFPLDVGFDGMITASPLPCVRVGLRGQGYWDRSAANDAVGYGIETQHKYWLAVGSEVAVHKTVDIGLYALPGLRRTGVRQRAVVPERDIDREYRSSAVRPSLYGYAVVRVWPTSVVGLHVDAQIAIADHQREYSWYFNRAFGAGISIRFPGKPVWTRQTPERRGD